MEWDALLNALHFKRMVSAVIGNLDACKLVVHCFVYNKIMVITVKDIYGKNRSDAYLQIEGMMAQDG